MNEAGISEQMQPSSIGVLRHERLRAVNHPSFDEVTWSYPDLLQYHSLAQRGVSYIPESGENQFSPY